MIILKIVPKDPFVLPGPEVYARLVEHVVAAFPGCEIADAQSDMPQFVDCGDGLEAVTCPLCRQAIDCEDWSILMDASYDDEGFTTLDIVTPCCGRPSRLDKLIYRAPCAFSCFEIDVADPPRIPPSLLRDLEAIAGFPFQTILAEYDE